MKSGSLMVVVLAALLAGPTVADGKAKASSSKKAATAAAPEVVVPEDAVAGGGPLGPGRSRFGIAVNLARADMRYELDPVNAVGIHLGIEMFGGGFKSHEFAFGGYFLRRIIEPSPLGMHYLGGMAVEASDDGLLEEYTEITVFAGMGVEYFLPGTSQLSVEASVGVALMSRDRKIKEEIGGTGEIKRGAGLAIRDLTGGVVMLRYYCE